MNKKYLIFLFLVFLTACSTFGGPKIEKENSVTAEFMGGEIKIVYTKDGQFESMTATGAARMIGDLPSSQEEAFTVAKLRAEQKMIEFMKIELESERFVKSLYDSMQDGQNTNRQSNTDVNSKIATKVQEDIKTRSKGILKGVHVESKKFDASRNIVLVTVKTGVKDIGTSKYIFNLMGN